MTVGLRGPSPVEHLKAARRGVAAYREALLKSAVNTALITQADAELAEFDAAIARLESA